MKSFILEGLLVVGAVLLIVGGVAAVAWVSVVVDEIHEEHSR